MTYDLFFTARRNEQSGGEPLGAAEGVGSDGAPGQEVWLRLVAAARQVLGEVSVSEDARDFELVHEPTAIYLNYRPNGARVTVPYWHQGADAEAVIKLVYQLGEVVQAVSGLDGYDPQLGLPLSDAVAQPELAVAIVDNTSASITRGGVASPGDG